MRNIAAISVAAGSCASLPRSATFCNDQQLVDAHVVKNVGLAANPMYLDPLHMVAFPQAELQSPTPVALVTATAVHLVHLHEVASDNLDSGPHAITVRIAAAQRDLNPVVVVLRIILQQSRLAA